MWILQYLEKKKTKERFEERKNKFKEKKKKGKQLTKFTKVVQIIIRTYETDEGMAKTDEYKQFTTVQTNLSSRVCSGVTD